MLLTSIEEILRRSRFQGSLGFGFGHVKFEIPVRYSGGVIEKAAGHIWASEDTYMGIGELSA